MGSGSLNAMAVFEAGFKEDMTREEAMALVAAAINVMGRRLSSDPWMGRMRTQRSGKTPNRALVTGTTVRKPVMRKPVMRKPGMPLV